MFRLRAKNQHGWGPYSLSTASIPSNVPAKMNVVTTVVDNTYIRIQWSPPDDMGAVITNYRILLFAADNISWKESEYCESSNMALVNEL